MEVRHARAVEYTLHDRFKTRRLHGEWFQLTKEEIASIQIDVKRPLSLFIKLMIARALNLYDEEQSGV
jgi:hypothetical protein